MNKYQKAFDTALTALRKQGKRCYSPKDGCEYRNGNLKCAIGHLISDEDLDRMEYEYSLETLVEKKYLPEFTRQDIMFLDNLQRTHDKAYNWELDFEVDMKFLAEQWGLKYE